MIDLIIIMFISLKLALIVVLGSAGLGSAQLFNPNVVHVVFFEMPPFIYRDQNGTLSGMFTDIAAKIYEICRAVELKFDIDTKNVSNFKYLMNDPSDIYYKIPPTAGVLWLSLAENIPKDFLDDLGLVSMTVFYSPGVEVLVHRNQIGFRAKIGIGIYGCRYLFVVCLISAVIFGIFIWIIVCGIPN